MWVKEQARRGARVLANVPRRAGADYPRGVVAVRQLSKASYRKMVQNLAWAVGYNVVAIPLAAGVLAPVGVVLPPAAGALAMSISTVVVAVNAMLLRRLNLRPAELAPDAAATAQTRALAPTGPYS